ncbi:MAG: class I SAM-dependent methyltransferase [Roseiarcus sp.]|jgi:SAM-dependent methyltransferase
MSQALRDYLSVWKEKPVLRVVYADIFDRIATVCVAGPTLEIGGGVGNLKERVDGVISSDIQYAEWLDLVADAQRLPFACGTLGNIVMLDVLHHIEFPALFFKEAQRVLRPGGRIVMVEPAITHGSWAFYNLFHPEPVVMSANPLEDGTPDPNRDAYESNQAIPTLLCGKYQSRFHRMFPALHIAQTRWFSFAVYPLSGGFRPWSLVTPKLAAVGLRIERFLERPLGRLLGFRLLMVIEKASV